MPRQIKVDLDLGGTPQEQATLATAMAPRFGWRATVNINESIVPNPVSAAEHLAMYAEQMFRDVAQAVIGDVVAEAARRSELAKPENQFESSKEAARKGK